MLAEQAENGKNVKNFSTKVSHHSNILILFLTFLRPCGQRFTFLQMFPLSIYHRDKTLAEKSEDRGEF